VKVAMKKLNILFLMSLLIASMNLAFASNEAFDQEQIVQSSVDASKEEFPRLSTEQYVYAITTVETPAEPGIIVAPEIVSDKIVGNYFNNGKTRTLITQETKDSKVIITTETWKTANPSYMTLKNGALVVGAVSVVGLSYMMVSKIQGDLAALRLDYENTWNKNLSDFKNKSKDSPEQRRKLLDSMFSNNSLKLTGAPDQIYLNVDSAYYLTDDLSKEEFTDFLERLNQHSHIKNSWLINLGDVAHVMDEMKVQDKISDTDLNDVTQFFKILSNKLQFAYHEAGHALIGALHENEPVLYATIMETENSGGHVRQSSRSLSELIFGYKDLENYRKQIKMNLAGGIAVNLLEKKERLSYEEFMSQYSIQNGMGDRNWLDSDTYQVYKDAENYYLYLNPRSWFSSNLNHEDKVHTIVKECYEEVYNELDAHQEQLAELGNKLYKDEVLSSAYIYEVANSTKPESNAVWKYLGI
jgi:Peptidase family M41